MGAQFEIVIKEDVSSAPQQPDGGKDRSQFDKPARSFSPQPPASPDAPTLASSQREMVAALQKAIEGPAKRFADAVAMFVKGTADKTKRTQKARDVADRAVRQRQPKEQKQQQPEKTRKARSRRDNRTWQNMFRQRARNLSKPARRAVAKLQGRARTAARTVRKQVSRAVAKARGRASTGVRRAAVAARRALGPRGRIAARSVARAAGVAARGARAVGAAAGGAARGAAGLLGAGGAAGPVGIAAAAVVAGFAAAGIAAKRFADFVEAETGRLSKYSGELSLAQSRTEVQRELARFDRAQQVGGSLAKFERVRADAEDAFYRLNTQLLQAILAALEPLIPLVEKLVTGASQSAPAILAVVDLMKIVLEEIDGLGALVPGDMFDHIADLEKHVRQLLNIAEDQGNAKMDGFMLQFLQSVNSARKGAGLPEFPGIPVEGGGV